jgi:hypothetical protein
MRSALVPAALALLAPAIAAAQPKQAAPAGTPAAKGPFACGAKILPLTVGNEWTYTPVTAPKPAEAQIARLSPPIPTQIVITVKSVDAKPGADTVVTLEEKVTYDLNKDLKKQPQPVDTVITSTITCGAKKFEISPNSFFFAGEPGGAYNLEFDKLDRARDTSLVLTNGSIGDKPWREDIAAHWKRTATKDSGANLGSGKLDLERQFTPQPVEHVTTKLGDFKCEKLALITTGRVTLDSPLAAGAKPMELPANWLSTIWMADNVGVVQTLNTYAHMYQLADAKLK